MNTQEFIAKASHIHGNKYCYDMVEYIRSHTKVRIVCPKHGMFEQTPNNHISKKQGCPLCAGNKKSTAEEFIIKARKVHGNKFDYSLVKYKNRKTKVKIVCSEHDVFEQIPLSHLNGHGCRLCYDKSVSVRLMSNLEEFIARAKQVHGDRYDYSLVEYDGSKSKVKIICPDHGVFEQKPNTHLQGFNCSECAGVKQHTTQSFIDMAARAHGDKYDYSMVEYINAHTKIKIICSVHGVFEQMPYSHSRGVGCPDCNIGPKVLETEEFITKAKQVHGDKYSYELVEYDGCRSSVKIICSIHGLFEQKPYIHLQNHGCPACSKSISRQELDLLDYIKSIYKGKIVTNTRKVISPYELDIYLPDIHKAFEYNGMYWHNEGLTKPIGYHQMKNDLCAHRGINLMHIWEHDWMNDNRFMKEVIKREIQL